MIINFLFLPVTMLFLCFIFFCVTSGAAATTINKKCFGIQGSTWRKKWARGLLVALYIVEICIFLPLATAATVVMTALVIVPAYFMQLYKLVRIFMLWCCKTNDRKVPAEGDLEQGLKS
jgi:hypothetical protein